MAETRFWDDIGVAANVATETIDIGRDPAIPGSKRFGKIWAKEVHADNVYATNLVGDPDIDGSKNLTFTVNSDAVNGTAENAALVIKSSDGAAIRSATLTMDAPNLKVIVDRTLSTSGDVVISADSKSLKVGAGADVAISHDGTNSTLTSTTGNFNLVNTNATGATIAKLGTATSATSFDVKDSADAFVLRAFGDGTVRVVKDASLNVGADNDISMSHDGTNSKIESLTGNLTILNSNATGATIAKLGTATSATSFKVVTSGDAACFTVNGAKESTFAGAVNHAVVTQSTTEAVSDVANYILVNTGAGGITLTLPPVTGRSGRVYTFKKINADATALTLEGDGAETIDGAANFAGVDAQYDCVTVLCDGDEWHIVGKMIA